MASSGASLLNQTGGWHPEPNFRGTYSILSSCWITLILCLWSAVHLNIPGPGKHGMQRWKKLGFVFLGIVAPEWVAWLAFCQYMEARDIHKAMTSILGQTEVKKSWLRWLKSKSKEKDVEANPNLEISEESGSERSKTIQSTQPTDLDAKTPQDEAILPTINTEDIPARSLSNNGSCRRHTWTMKHSFYAIMGGFTLENEERDQPATPEGIKRIVLTGHGVIWLTKNHPEMIPNLSESEISDKSTSNTLAKLIACIQATWFCINCIVRVSQHLTVSLLELNTAAHAICALVVYFLWWNKPQDVGVPTILHGTLDENLIRMSFACKPTLFRPNGRNTQEYRRGAQETHISNFDTMERGTSQSLIAVVFAGLFYGGMHLSAWNDQSLGTHLGPLFWRISCICITSSAVYMPIAVVFANFAFDQLNEKINNCSLDNMGRRKDKMKLLLEGVFEIIRMTGILLILFIFLCRLNLVVEAYYSLKNLPVSAYQQPDWSQYIPHFQ